MTNSAEKYPDFFKVFLPEKHSERMLIPNAFVKLTRFQERIPEDVILQDRSGRVWHVKARPIGNQLYLDDGWKQFREENYLEAADFIIFTHVGNNVFKFKILELSSCCEKKEHRKENDDMMEVEEEGEEDQEQDEDSGDDYDDDDDDEDDEDEDIDMEKENEEYNGNKKIQSHCGACKAPVNCKRDIGSNSATKAELDDHEIEAENYINPNNPHFAAKLTKSRPNELHIPKRIVKDFALSFPKKITLECCQCQDIQRNEMVDYHLSLPQQIPIKYGGRGQVCTWKDGRVCIKGWARFCRKYKIKENDVCICEIVLQEDKIIEMLRVHVCSAREE